MPAEILTKHEYRAPQTAPPTAAPTRKHRLRGEVRRIRTDRTLRRWLLAWVGAPALAIANDALSIGAIWVALSVLFEFGLGHYVEGDSWADLFQNYDVTAGNIWIIILLWIAAGPATVRAIAGEPR